MSSYTQKPRVDNAESGRGARSNSFEENESNHKAGQKSGSAYNDAELTELAVPSPAAEDDDMRDTYEEEEMKRTSSSLRREDQNDGELTELAAPAPISSRGNSGEEGGDPAVTDRSHYEGSTDIQNEEQADQVQASSYSAYAEFCTVSWLVFFTSGDFGSTRCTGYINVPKCPLLVTSPLGQFRWLLISRVSVGRSKIVSLFGGGG